MRPPSARERQPARGECTGATPFLSSYQHDAQECPSLQRCVQEFSAQESGAGSEKTAYGAPLIHPSFRPVLLVANESWYSIDISRILEILRSHPSSEVRCCPSALCYMRQVRTLGSIANASDLTPSADNGMLRSAYLRHLDTRESFVCPLLNRSHRHFVSCSHPTEPQCSYDPVEGLPLAPDADPIDKIRELEEQVGMFLCCSPYSTVLTFLCSFAHEETKITEGKRTALSFSISQSSSPSF